MGGLEFDSHINRLTMRYWLLFDFLSHFLLPPRVYNTLVTLRKLENGELAFDSPEGISIVKNVREISNLFKIRAACFTMFLTCLLAIYYMFTVEFKDEGFVIALIETLFCFVWLALVRFDVVSIDRIAIWSIAYAWFVITLCIFFLHVDPFDIPMFFKHYVTHFSTIPVTSVYFLRGKKSLIFIALCYLVLVISFYGSIGETFTITLDWELHSLYLSVATFAQIYPPLVQFLFKVEVDSYHGLLLRYLELTEEKSEAKTLFISRMSHELKTPLHGLLSSASLIRQTKITEEQSAYLSTVDSCGSLLFNIVMQILDIVRIESGNFETQKESFNLFQLVQTVTDTLVTLAESKGIEVLVFFKLHPEGYDVEGDSLHLKEILINLIGNALKFTEKGRVTVSVFRFEEQKDQFYRFEIEDTGPGIPSEQISIIFKPFTQLNRLQKKSDGSGLGLYISRSFVEVMKGRMGVESNVGEKSLFWFEVPLRPLPKNSITSPLFLLPFQPLSGVFSEYKIGIFGSRPQYELLGHYFSNWGLTNFHELNLSDFQHHDDDFVIVDDNFDLAISILQHFETKKRKSRLPSGRFLILFSPLSGLSRIFSKIREEFKQYENQFLIVTKPLGPLKLFSTIKILFEGHSPPDLEIPQQHRSILDPSRAKDVKFVSLEKTESQVILHESQSRLENEENIGETNENIEVLVVEDNRVNQMIMRNQLKKLNVSFKITSSGEESVEIWKAHSSSLKIIFMDVEIDGPIDGLHATSLIRAFEKERNEKLIGNETPNHCFIVIMTGRSLEEDQREAFQFGCDLFLTKPVKLQKIIEIVNQKVHFKTN